MKILAIGDVTSPRGLEHLNKNLWSVRKKYGIDMCIVNAENASFITGISPEGAEQLFRCGADVITGGNHTLKNKAVYRYIEENGNLLRPINFGDTAPGCGSTVVDVLGYRVLVISALGTVHMEPTLDSPFTHIDRLLTRMEGKYDLAVCDIHAEATGEKLAVAYAYDGKINVIFGTHTHVPTADNRILPNGTGYISDLGMCGESGGILGMDADTVVRRMRERLPHKFVQSSGAPVADGVIFTLDTTSRRVTDITRISF